MKNLKKLPGKTEAPDGDYEGPDRRTGKSMSYERARAILFDVARRALDMVGEFVEGSPNAHDNSFRYADGWEEQEAVRKRCEMVVEKTRIKQVDSLLGEEKKRELRTNNFKVTITRIKGGKTSIAIADEDGNRMFFHLDKNGHIDRAFTMNGTNMVTPKIHKYFTGDFLDVQLSEICESNDEVLEETG